MKLNERECIQMHVKQNALLLNARKCACKTECVVTECTQNARKWRTHATFR